jgi:hypothetical protein
VLLVAESSCLVSRDEITVDHYDDGGTAVTYSADLRLRGPLRLFDPVLQVVLNRIGDHARDGLAEKLAQSLSERHGARAA